MWRGPQTATVARSDNYTNATMNSILPEETPYLTSDPVGGNASFDLDVAIQGPSLFGYQEQEQVSLRSSEALATSEQFKRISLDDIEVEPLRLSEGPLDFDAYLREPQDEAPLGGAFGYSHEAPSGGAFGYSQDQPSLTTATTMGGNLFTPSTLDQGYLPLSGDTNYQGSSIKQKRTRRTSDKPSYQPALYQSDPYGAQSSSFAAGAPATTSSYQQVDYQNYSDNFGFQNQPLTPLQLPLETQHYGTAAVIQQPSDNYNQYQNAQTPPLQPKSQHHKKESFQLLPETQPLRTDVLVSSNETSPSRYREAYTHRHERVYGLSTEDQKERSRELNNEASQLYRQKKNQKLKDIEAQVKQEEDRNKKLKKIYRQLLKEKEKRTQAQLQGHNSNQ